MTWLLTICLAAMLLVTPPPTRPAVLATCTGATPCKACKNCSACKFCRHQGGRCGTCYQPQ